MSEFDFNILTERDKNNVSYTACLGGSALTGMAVGRFLGLQGLLAGGAGGLVIGLMACKRLSPLIKQKFLNPNVSLTERELVESLQAVREVKPGINKSEALQLFAAVREEVGRQPAKYSCHI